MPSGFPTPLGRCLRNLQNPSATSNKSICPPEYKTDLNKWWAMLFWREQKRTKSDDGWLMTIGKIYRRNSVGSMSAKYCSDAKWCAQHGRIIYFFSNSFAEKVIKCRRLHTTVCPDEVFSRQKKMAHLLLKSVLYDGSHVRLPNYLRTYGSYIQ